MVIDEFRLVKEEDVTSIIQPTMQIRVVPCLKKEVYSNIKILKEEPKEVYLSSAWWTSNWYYKVCKDAILDMYKGKALFFSTDYALCLRHGIKTENQLKRAKRRSSTDSWLMEYMNIPLGGAENQYYNYELLEASQTLQRVFYPKTREEYFDRGGKKKRFGDIPKLKDEVRIITLDIAVASSTKKVKNDFSSIKLQRAMPTPNGYEIQECYLEEFEGTDIDTQALRVKQLFMLYDADIIVYDGKTLGITFTDAMAKVVYDSEFEVDHPPMKCFNDEDHGARCKSSNAIPCMYVFIGDSKRNHLGHTSFKSKLQQKMYKLPISTMRSIDLLKERNEYNLGDLDTQARYESLFILAEATVHEMMNLNKVDAPGGYVKLEEPSGGTKDKYMSSMMGVYYVSQELDPKISSDDEEEEVGDDYSYCVGKLNWY